MEPGLHRFCELFQQLGLPADVPAIERFIAAHRPLPPEVRLADAPFWSESQRAMIRQAIADDADWAALVDQLSLRLRA